MKFFKDLKDDLKELVQDLSTVEHAILQENDEGEPEVLIYRKQQNDGDSIIYLTSKHISKETVKAFNELFRAGIVSRQGILNAVIKIFKP